VHAVVEVAEQRDHVVRVVPVLGDVRLLDLQLQRGPVPGQRLRAAPQHLQLGAFDVGLDEVHARGLLAGAERVELTKPRPCTGRPTGAAQRPRRTGLGFDAVDPAVRPDTGRERHGVQAVLGADVDADVSGTDEVAQAEDLVLDEPCVTGQRAQDSCGGWQASPAALAGDVRDIRCGWTVNGGRRVLHGAQGRDRHPRSHRPRERSWNGDPGAMRPPDPQPRRDVAAYAAQACGVTMPDS
jgi:hypothetical protein